MPARNRFFFERLSLNLGSSGQRLDSISDLKKINFGESVPMHGLILLYWFANAIDIDDSDNMRLTFDVNRGDYGSHKYHNSETLLAPPPSGYHYYTIGNHYKDPYRLLPNYVVNPPREYAGDNRVRIIVRVQLQNREQAGNTTDQVYLTQHLSEDQGPSYDSDHTYRITPKLLRELRIFCVRENQLQLLQLRDQFNSSISDSQIRLTRSEWPGRAGLGLLIFIVTGEDSWLKIFYKFIIFISVVAWRLLLKIMSLK